MLTKQEIGEWQTHKVSKDFVAELEVDRQEILEAWAGGAYTDSDAEGTIQKNSEAIGKVQAIDYVLQRFRNFHEDGEVI